MNFNNTIEKIIRPIPHIGKWRKTYKKHHNPGHFYSPIPDLEWVHQNEDKIYSKEKTFLQIDFNDNKQIELLNMFANYIPNYPYYTGQNDSYRFTEDNNIYYAFYDASVLFSIMCHFKPKRIVEVGSGFSSALMLDTNEFFLNNTCNIIFVEPFPEERLLNLKKENDKINLEKKYIQNVPLNVFTSLEENDIFFVDSSHISKIDSDLNHIIFEILPRLKKGVLVHFHDVHFPFEYPKQWIDIGYAFNETYILRAFLMNNTEFEILFMDSYLHHKQKLTFNSIFNPNNIKGEYDISKAGSLWLRKK